MEDTKIIMKRKEFNYRGKPIEELKQMEVREFAKLLKSKTRRAVLRQSDELQKFIIKCNKCIQNKKQIRTHSRQLVIIPKMIGLTIQVYNGRIFFPVQISGEMIGHRLGEFSVTRTKVKHGVAGVGATRSSASMSVK